MIWRDFSKAFKDGDHAFLSPSQHSWFNYDDEKLVKTYLNKMSAAQGSALHALACNLIKMKVRLPDLSRTLNMYVNDCIECRMRPEYKMYYSPYCYGTADAISYEDHTLRVFDLKNGKIKVSFVQLEIYAALFFLCYPEVKLPDTDIELRVYQSDEIRVENPEPDIILPIMDKIVRYSKVLDRLEEEYNDEYGISSPRRSWTR